MKMMMRKNQVVPRTPTGTLDFPKWAKLLLAMVPSKTLREVTIRHEDGCPCLVGTSMDSCSCVKVDIALEPVAHRKE